MTLEYVTLVNNRSDTSSESDVAGLFVRNDRSVTVRNSILSGNTLANGTKRDCIGAIDNYSDNLINDPQDSGSSACDAAAETEDDPVLGSLGNGAYWLQTTSPALNSATCLAHINTDQRGNPRSSDTTYSRCDMGAWEGQRPGQITSFSATAGNGSISVGVTAPSTTGDYPISDYEYRTSTDNATWGAVGEAGNVTSFNITGLTNGTTYYVQVRAQNAAEVSDWSASKSATPSSSAGGTIYIDSTCDLDEAVENANDNAATNTDCEAGSGWDTIVFLGSGGGDQHIVGD